MRPSKLLALLRPCQTFALALVCLLLVAVGASVACGLFRGGRAARACGGGQPSQMAMMGGDCGGGCCSAGGCASGACSAMAGGCGCCDGCQCGEICPCQFGRAPCCDGCRCQLASNQRACCAAPAVDPDQFPGIPQAQFDAIGKTERYQINGRNVSKRDVIQALSTVPDDRKELSLTFVGGSDEQRAAAVALAHQMGLDKKTLIHDYPDDSPLIKGKGFASGTILESPDGLALLQSRRMDQPVLLAVAAKAAAYDPNAAPSADGLDLGQISKQLAALPWYMWLGIGALASYLYLKKKESAK